MMEYTIKDIQKELNISEKTARRLIKQYAIMPSRTDSKTKAHYYSADSVKLLGLTQSDDSVMTQSDDQMTAGTADNINNFTRSNDSVSTRSNDRSTEDYYIKQLDILRKQLEEKDRQINNLQTLLSQQQQLSLHYLGYTKETDEPKEKTEEPKKGFFERLFGK